MAVVQGYTLYPGGASGGSMCDLAYQGQTITLEDKIPLYTLLTGLQLLQQDIKCLNILPMAF